VRKVASTPSCSVTVSQPINTTPDVCKTWRFGAIFRIRHRYLWSVRVQSNSSLQSFSLLLRLHSKHILSYSGLIYESLHLFFSLPTSLLPYNLCHSLLRNASSIHSLQILLPPLSISPGIFRIDEKIPSSALPRVSSFLIIFYCIPSHILKISLQLPVPLIYSLIFTLQDSLS
jgi:hypothetical protein